MENDEIIIGCVICGKPTPLNEATKPGYSPGYWIICPECLNDPPEEYKPTYPGLLNFEPWSIYRKKGGKRNITEAIKLLIEFLENH